MTTPKSDPAIESASHLLQWLVDHKPGCGKFIGPGDITNVASMIGSSYAEHMKAADSMAKLLEEIPRRCQQEMDWSLWMTDAKHFAGRWRELNQEVEG